MAQAALNESNVHEVTAPWNMFLEINWLPQRWHVKLFPFSPKMMYRLSSSIRADNSGSSLTKSTRFGGGALATSRARHGRWKSVRAKNYWWKEGNEGTKCHKRSSSISNSACWSILHAGPGNICVHLLQWHTPTERVCHIFIGRAATGALLSAFGSAMQAALMFTFLTMLFLCLQRALAVFQSCA